MRSKVLLLVGVFVLSNQEFFCHEKKTRDNRQILDACAQNEREKKNERNDTITSR